MNDCKMESNVICPVCTLFLRPGITLKTHLSTHPKQKVIDALVKLAETEPHLDNTEQEVCPAPLSSVANTSWNSQGTPQIPTPLQGNHVFIYQQSMSTSQTNTLNPLTQYVIPAVFNPQMTPQMAPYVYQQQLIMSSGSCLPQMRLAPFELTAPFMSPSSEITPPKTTTIEELENDAGDDIVEIQEIDVKDTEEEGEGKKIEDADEKFDSKSEEAQTERSMEEETEESSAQNEQIQSDSRWNTFGSSEELSKACQTTTTTTSQQDVVGFNKKPEYYYFNNESENAVNYSNAHMENVYEQQDPIYTSTNILQSTEHLDFLEVDGMQVVINDFTDNSVITQVNNFENGNECNVLMNIGETMMSNEQKEGCSNVLDVEESVSRGSAHVNIRADEKMPPRGELSGQESLGGTSDINWNRLHYNEGSCGASYYLMGRGEWEDSSDIDCPPQNEENYDVSYTPPPPLHKFKCSNCDETFASSQERERHETEKHNDKDTNKPELNIIGSRIGKKKVKKLVVKLKTEPETNYDTVFTNKIKIETGNNNEQCKSEMMTTSTTTTAHHQVDDNKIDDNLSGDSRTICSVCNAVLPDAKSLKLHKAEIHRIPTDLRFKCSTCAESFQNEYKYTVHLKVHPLECKLCGKLFYRRQNIQLHMKRHLGIKPYKCEFCEKAFMTKQKLEEHRNVHTGHAPIKCNLCDETFRRHSNLVQHRNRHHLKLKRKVKDYVCHCGEYFHSRKKLAWHKETHDPKPKACTKCSEKFVHLASLTRHMRKTHNERYLPKEERSNENVECPICKGIFIKSSLEVHIRTHSGARPYTCLICNKDFTTRWNLKLHKWTHASRVSKPFKCDQCNGAFVRESDYVSHMNSHKSIKPYTCNYCGARFIRKYNCQRHVKEHENDKTYTCTVCDKSFHRSYYLKDHMRVHSGVRPYTCHVCGKTSTTKSNHNKHVQIHHAREPVSTEN